VIENNICEGTDCLKAALCSSMTGLQVMVASATSVKGEQRGLKFPHIAAVLLVLESDGACTSLNDQSARNSIVLLISP